MPARPVQELALGQLTPEALLGVFLVPYKDEPATLMNTTTQANAVIHRDSLRRLRRCHGIGLPAIGVFGAQPDQLDSDRYTKKSSSQRRHCTALATRWASEELVHLATKMSASI